MEQNLNLNNKLKVDYCNYQAARYAVMRWHYSRSMPVGKLYKLGVWEGEKFIGAVLFGLGANKNMGNPLYLKQFEYCELVRVALDKHTEPVTKIISICLRILKKDNPKLKAVISYADPEIKHLGIIYQAGNWLYTGCSAPSTVFIHNGKKVHSRVTVEGGKQFGRPVKAKIDISKAVKKTTLPKFRYLYLYDQSHKDKIKHLIQTYPKKLKQAVLA